jgi:hypothetical protein
MVTENVSGVATSGLFEGADWHWWNQVECDGYFLIVDTAVHNGVNVDVDELVDHVRSCAACSEQDNRVTLDGENKLTEK